MISAWPKGAYPGCDGLSDLLSTLCPFINRIPWRKTMEGLTRVIFNAATDGDKAAMLQMEKAADEGSKDAEALLFQLTRENQVATGESNFGVAFARVAEANQLLHIAYLNCNGPKW